VTLPAFPSPFLGMTEPHLPHSIGVAADELASVLALPRRQKVVLVMDLVESVRLMAANELRVIGHWREFVHHTVAEVLPRHHGRLVKSLGDGIMAEFDAPRDAVAAALQLQHFFDDVNTDLPEPERLYLRAGLNATHVYVDDIDIYGSGVNLAARVAGLAGPGETMVTSRVRDELADGLDVEIEDMGECHLKHVATPIRAYRLGAPGPMPILVPEHDYQVALKAAIAVIPLDSRAQQDGDGVVGELIADGVINHLGRSGDLRVLSRLTTSYFKGRQCSLEEIGTRLRADYVLSGSYVAVGAKALMNVELASTKTLDVLWSDRLETAISDLLQLESQTLHHIANQTHLQILNAETALCLIQPLPTLPSYSMMLASVQMMHRQSRDEFARARILLQHLSERHPRIGTPYAWTGKWYALCAAQNWGEQPAEDLKRAKEAVDRALALEGAHSLALTIRGLIAGYVERDFAAAATSYEAALAVNPNEPLAWLYRATLAAWTGAGADAIAHADNALALSPVDPMRYYFESLAAIAHLAGGQYDKAIQLARESLRRNKVHASTHKTLVVALSLAGRQDECAKASAELLKVVPGYTVETFLSTSPLAASPDRLLFAEALRAAGIPDR
jgi:adenylate cyclase